MANIKDYIGHTLEDLAKTTGMNFKGWCVFQLQDREDTTGVLVGECFTVREILRRYPEAAGLIVKLSNEFYGQIILRAIAPAMVADKEKEAQA